MDRYLAILSVLVVSACAAPAPVVVETPAPPAPETPSLSALIAVDGGLAVRSGESRALGIEGEVQGIFPGGRDGAVLFALSQADSTLLYRARRDRVERLHAVSGEAVYTVAWNGDGTQAAFGHYAPLGEASPGRPRMGAGDILLFDGTSVSRVGCSASRAVLAWDPQGRLLVRNTDNLYLVDRDGCDTVATVDARRMHGLTVSPDGLRMAFVHRELEFDRATRSYVADSTFRMTNLDGTDAKTVVSFRYRPERLAWRDDGSELAFDVYREESGGGRAISIFDSATGNTAFLHPPSEGRPGEFEAAWAPGGERIAYRRDEGDGARSVWVRTFASMFPTAVPDATEILFWQDANTIVCRRADGAVLAQDLSSGEVTEMGRAEDVIGVWRADR